MQIIRQGEWLKAARITGPTHQFLGLRFGSEPLNDPRPAVADVLDGVALANAELGTRYRVSAVQLADGDEYSRRIYTMMAYQLVMYAAEQGLQQAA